MGFGALTPHQIVEGIARLSDVVDDRLDRHHNFLQELLLADAGHPRFNLPQPGGRKPAPPSRRELALHGIWPGKPHSHVRKTQREMPRMLVDGLYRYPVKGLSPERVPLVDLEPGKPFPFDRVFALARANSSISQENPSWAKKAIFLMLMLEERLALAQTRVDPETLRMTIRLDGQTRVTAPLDTREGRAEVEQLMGGLAYPGAPLPRLVFNPAGHFMDKPDNVVSMINLASLRDLEARWGTSLDPLRFRANIYFDGAGPWEEFSWIGSEITIGNATFMVDRRNGRCGATNVNPVTGERDRDIPSALRATFGHKDLGIYLVTTSGGRITTGDRIVAGKPVAPPTLVPQSHHPVQTSQMICRGCYYIYNDAAQPAPFMSLPSSWTCPDCGADIGKFQAQPAR
jgi:GntR family transcriptional regulator/MocR family aminotransferase